MTIKQNIQKHKIHFQRMDDQPTQGYIRQPSRPLRSIIIYGRCGKPIDRADAIETVRQNDSTMWTVSTRSTVQKLLYSNEH